MDGLARTIPADQRRYPEPSMVMLGTQTVLDDRAGPTFHDARESGWPDGGGQTLDPCRVEILGLSLAVRVDPARSLVGHELIERIAKSHRYRLTGDGLRRCYLLTKLAGRVLDPGLARCGPPATPSPPWQAPDRPVGVLLRRANLVA